MVFALTDRLGGGGPMDRWPPSLPVTGNEMLELMTLLGRRLDEMNQRLERIEKRLDAIEAKLKA